MLNTVVSDAPLAIVNSDSDRLGDHAEAPIVINETVSSPLPVFPTVTVKSDEAPGSALSVVLSTETVIPKH